jgi:hypothetical protein
VVTDKNINDTQTIFFHSFIGVLFSCLGDREGREIAQLTAQTLSTTDN